MKRIVILFLGFVSVYEICGVETVAQPTIQVIERTFISAFTGVYGTDILDIAKADAAAITRWRNSLQAIHDYLQAKQSVLLNYFKQLEMIIAHMAGMHTAMAVITKGIPNYTSQELISQQERLNRFKSNLEKNKKLTEDIKQQINALQEVDVQDKRFIETIFIGFTSENIKRTLIKIEKLNKDIDVKNKQLIDERQQRLGRLGERRSSL